jgi:hypothetical protein
MPTAEERERLADILAQKRSDTPPDSPRFILAPGYLRGPPACIPITVMRSCSRRGSCCPTGLLRRWCSSARCPTVTRLRVGEAEGDEETVKLVKQVDGKAGQGAKGAKYPPGRTYLGAPRTAGGGVVDGAVTRLAGEPLVAVTKGWGDLTLMYRPMG